MMKEKLFNRFNILAACFILCGLLIVYSLADLQLVQGKEFDDKSQRGLLSQKEIPAPRGNILDSNGVPIAVNRMGFTVQIVNTKLKNKELNEMLLRLVRIFEKNKDTYNGSLEKYLTSNPLEFGTTVKKSQKPVDRIIGDLELKVKTKDQNLIDTPKALFKYLREEKYEIDPSYTDEEAYKIMKLRYEIRRYGVLNAVVVASDVSKETVAEVEEMHHLFPGVTTDVEPIRRYIDAQNMAHILGYIGAINADTYEKVKDQGYGKDDLIGVSGIEKSQESVLRGSKGEKSVEVDTNGRLTEVLGESPAVPGKDVFLTIDMKLQKVAQESLARTIEQIRASKASSYNYGDADAGAVVALDVNTGEVLAMASYPTYDPAIFLAGPEDKEAQKARVEMQTNPKISAEINRAIGGRYAPGSTFKPLVGIAALEEGVILPETKIYDAGVLEVDNWKFTCMEYRHGLPPHGWLNMEKALATSCNIFFHDIGMRLGIDKIEKWARAFGLGEKSGIDIGGESSGLFGGRAFKEKQFNDDWRVVDTGQTAIGQMYNSYTPLQLANYIATIANGGTRYTPQLVKRVVSYDGAVVQENEPKFEKLPVKASTIEAVKKGMVAVNNSEDGTAVSVWKDFPYKVAGKTGTAETGQKNASNNGVYVCYAPADKPEIAIAVVVEHGVYGYYTAPVAKDILTEYFKLNKQQEQPTDTATADKAVFTH